MASGIIDFVLRQAFAPRRCDYTEDEACNVITGHMDDVFIREPVKWKWDGLAIEASLWKQVGTSPQMCVVYVHSLGTNQFEVVNLVPFLVGMEVGLCSFDLPGCGLSGGKAVPIDGSGVPLLERVLGELRFIGFSRFALWGRSLGAAISLHAAGVGMDVVCVVADSSFVVAREVVLDVAAGSRVPRCFGSCLFPWLRRRAQAELSIDIGVPFPQQFVGAARIPLLMGHGDADTFVTIRHAHELYDLYGGQRKTLYIFSGTHNSPRPAHWYQAAGRFVYRNLGASGLGRNYSTVFEASALHIGRREDLLAELGERGRPVSEVRASRTMPAQV